MDESVVIIRSCLFLGSRLGKTRQYSTSDLILEHHRPERRSIMFEVTH